MPTKSLLTKTQKNKIKKQVKKNPKPFIILGSIILVIAITGGVAYYIYKQKNKVPSEGISINFLELGNHHTGDCTYIKAGDMDILIDAGSTGTSAETIANFLDKEGRVEDGKLEYVIATHAHKDHIAGFVGTSDCKGLLDRYKVDNIIQYSQNYSKSELSKQFDEKIETAVTAGTRLIKADEAAGQTYDLSQGITMKILDHKYYHEQTTNENNHSVCALFTQGDNHYLFTGDLEATGEKSLVETNPFLPKVKLFKGAHHGSYTANTDVLLNVIQPEVICICCCAGNNEYTSDAQNMFPAQETINRYALYTEKIYVTTVSTDGKTGFASMNGDITFKCESGNEYKVTGSNNNLILKDTEWFKKNRTWPS